MAIKANGREYDLPLIPAASMLTTTSQYHVVGIVPTTTVGDRIVVDSGATNTTICAPTGSALWAVGINQSYLSASSEVCNIRMFGVSKATCAESISAGAPVMAYHGVSTSTRTGQIVQVDNANTCTGYGMSVTSQCRILGFALEDGSTATVISVFVNPSHYDYQLVGSIGIT